MILTDSQLTADRALGGKGHGLRRLRAAGVPVPDFAVIPAETFDAAVQGLSTDANGQSLRRACLQRFELSAADEQDLQRLLAGWGFPAQPVVVRSSAADEDGARTALAGLMDSFMNLTTLPQVREAVARCAASAYSARAVAYRQIKQMPVARPAVIVQRQVTPVASGVVFTTLPEYSLELAVHAVWGFGEGLVGGALEPDEFYFTKTTGQPSRSKLATKPQQYLAIVGAGAPGLRLAGVPPANQHRACLTPEQLAQLVAVGTRLERELGGPQDMEFVATAAGEVWLVQARPITQDIPDVVVYDNSNIQESYCGVTTPLTFSFAQRAYATVYRQTMRVLGLPPTQIAAHEAVVTQLLGLVKGRIYYHINHWYQGLQLLPSFRQNKADMERMMGLEEPVDFVTDQRKTLAEKLQLLPALALNLGRLLWAFGQLKNRVPAFHQQFRAHYERFYAQPLAALDATALLAQKQLLDDELLGAWTTPIINDFYVMMANGQVARALLRAGVAAPDEFLSRYLAGDAQIASTQPTHRMQALARAAWPHPELRQLILALPADVHAQVARLAPDFHAAVTEFIGQYGDRTAGELKLETLTMRARPAVFYHYLRNFLLVDAPPAPAAPAASPLHEQARRELEALLASRPIWTRPRTWRALGKLQQAIRYREALRLERTRLFGMYRALYLAMGGQLMQRKRLAEARDVFWLAEAEILAALAPDGAACHSLVTKRRQEFAGYAAEDVPSRVTVPSWPGAEPPAHATPGALRGTGCFPGTAEGEVLVITDPGGDLGVTGKIVCALRTDPGWAALFPTCRGVIIEKGSSLSHSVILLRELGIPTIINVPGITRQLRSGQRVRINGQTGEIELLP